MAAEAVLASGATARAGRWIAPSERPAVIHLPALNATLNAVAFVFLIAGWRAIKNGRPEAHKKLMLAALAASTLFLVSYLTHHATSEPTRFTRTGWIRGVYYFVLATHIPLAALMVPPILRLTWLGLKGRLAEHKRLARWTFPVWVYVSITGVLVYWMLYRL